MATVIGSLRVMLGLDSARFSNGLKAATRDTKKFAAATRTAMGGGPGGGRGGFFAGAFGGPLSVGKLAGLAGGFSVLHQIRKGFDDLSAISTEAAKGGAAAAMTAANQRNLYPTQAELARMTAAGAALRDFGKEYGKLKTMVLAGSPVQAAASAPMNIVAAAKSVFNQMLGGSQAIQGNTPYIKGVREAQYTKFHDQRNAAADEWKAANAAVGSAQEEARRRRATLDNPKISMSDDARISMQAHVRDLDRLASEAGRRRAAATKRMIDADMEIEAIGEAALRPVIEGKLAAQGQLLAKAQEAAKGDRGGSFGMGSADSLRFMPRGGAGSFVEGNRKIDISNKHLESIDAEMKRLTQMLEPGHGMAY